MSVCNLRRLYLFRFYLCGYTVYLNSFALAHSKYNSTIILHCDFLVYMLLDVIEIVI